MEIEFESTEGAKRGYLERIVRGAKQKIFDSSVILDMDWCCEYDLYKEVFSTRQSLFRKSTRRFKRRENIAKIRPYVNAIVIESAVKDEEQLKQFAIEIAKKVRVKFLSTRYVPDQLKGIHCQYCGFITEDVTKCTHCGGLPI